MAGIIFFRAHYRLRADTGLDLTVCVSRCWRGNVTNMRACGLAVRAAGVGRGSHGLPVSESQPMTVAQSAGSSVRPWCLPHNQ